MTAPSHEIEGAVEADGCASPTSPQRRPLALCLRGSDSPGRGATAAGPGESAVSGPWPRGCGAAPTDVPAAGRYRSAVLVDAALHEALGGGEDAVLVGHDWGALAGYAAAHHAGTPWRRLVALAVPPASTMAAGFLSYDQLKRSWYMFFFQHPLAELAVPADDLAFVDRLWAEWSPGYDATEDLPRVKESLRDPANLAAASATTGDARRGRTVRRPRGRRCSRRPTAARPGADAVPPRPHRRLRGVELAEQAAVGLTHPGSRVGSSTAPGTSCTWSARTRSTG